MTMHATTEGYYEEGIKQAKALFDRLYPRKSHGVDLTMDADAIRKRVDSDEVPGDTLIQSSLADLLLRLGQKVGIDRRKLSPPPSPFKKIKGRGNAAWATKDEAIRWDAAWHLREGASDVAQRLQGSGAKAVQGKAAMVRQKLLWIVEHGDVLGWLEDLPVSLFEQAKVEDLAIHSWTVEQALHRPWRSVDERDLWVNRYEAGHRLLETEIRRLALPARAGARARADETSPPDL